MRREAAIRRHKSEKVYPTRAYSPTGAERPSCITDAMLILECIALLESIRAGALRGEPLKFLAAKHQIYLVLRCKK